MRTSLNEDEIPILRSVKEVMDWGPNTSLPWKHTGLFCGDSSNETAVFPCVAQAVLHEDQETGTYLVRVAMQLGNTSHAIRGIEGTRIISYGGELTLNIADGRFRRTHGPTDEPQMLPARVSFRPEARSFWWGDIELIGGAERLRVDQDISTAA